MKVMDKGYVLIMINVFNLSLGRIMIEFCKEFSMDILNCKDTIKIWTFKSVITEF